MSPSDAELSSPELTACRDRHIATGEEDGDGEQEKISENGQEVTEAQLKQQHFMCYTETLVMGGSDKNVTQQPNKENMQEQRLICVCQAYISTLYKKLKFYVCFYFKHCHFHVTSF